MTRGEIDLLVEEVRTRQTELDSVEVKSARGGTPKRIYEAFSAFANRTGGGEILFDLDEEHGFDLVGVDNAHRLQEEFTHVAADQMEPPLRPEFAADEIDGAVVVAAVVDEVRAPLRAVLQSGVKIGFWHTTRYPKCDGSWQRGVKEGPSLDRHLRCKTFRPEGRVEI